MMMMSIERLVVVSSSASLLLLFTGAIVQGFAVKSHRGNPSLRMAPSEEDLELTRQIILEHIRKQVNDDDDDESAAALYNTDVTEEPPPVTAAPPATATATKEEEHDFLMIRAARGEPVERIPVWLFRQAGRHLPEYQDYKRQTGKNFLQLLQDPQCVAECTLQPLRRYAAIDAAILFSDILVIPQALGIEVTMPGGVGIQVPHPLQHRNDVYSRLPAIQDLNADFVRTKLSHVLEAVRCIQEQLKKEELNRPLIGFSAAPWTLLYYMVGGSSKRNTDQGVYWLETFPVASQNLLDKLTRVVIEYLSAQVQEGCQLLQIFEAMGMMIDEQNFVKYALPCLNEIGRELKARHPDVPLLVFCRGACQWNDKVAALGWYDVITLDDSVDRVQAAAAAAAARAKNNNFGYQGNFHPAELVIENGKTVESVRASARKMLQDFDGTLRIANLGQGLSGKESPELVAAFCNAIHQESEKMQQQQKKRSRR